MFTIKNLLKNIPRYSKRYVPLGLIILFLLTVNIAVRCIRHEAEAIVVETLDRYGTELYLVDLSAPILDMSAVESLRAQPYVLELRTLAAFHNLEKVEYQDGMAVYKRDIEMIAVPEETLTPHLTAGRLYRTAEECCLNEGYYNSLTKSGALSGLGGTVTLDDPRTEHTTVFTVVGVIADLDAPYCDAADYMEKRAYLMEEAIAPYWKRLRSWAMPEHMNKAYAEAAAQGIREADVDLSYMRVIEGYEIFLRIDTYRSSEDLRREVRALNDAPAGSLRMRHRYLVGETTSGIAALTAPMEKISSLCGTIDRVTLAVSLAIMLLLTLLIVTERRYEIGILRCLGVTAGGVCARFVFELFAFLVIVLALSFALGVPAAMLFARRLDMTIGYAALARSAWDVLLLLGGMGLVSSVLASALILSKRPMEILNSRT